MRQIKITLAYDGTGYSGWQIQMNAVTIQEVVQKAVRGMTGEENNVVGAGRTDAGVHALAQVASFRTEKDIPLEGFRRGLNTNLPPDIRIIKAEEVSEDFHPIRDSKSKQYRYLISEGENEHPLCLNRAWCVGMTLNLTEMQRAAQVLVGQHDFSAFAASDGCDDNRVKEVFDVILSETTKEFSVLTRSRGGPFASLRMTDNCDTVSMITYYALNIIGSGFLKHMVRNIVGTLVDVGRGKIGVDDFRKILDSKDRKKAGVTAPASGLYLVEVRY